MIALAKVRFKEESWREFLKAGCLYLYIRMGLPID